MNFYFLKRFSTVFTSTKAERGESISLGLLFLFSAGVIIGYFMHGLSLVQAFSLFREGEDAQSVCCILSLIVVAGLLILLSFSTSYLGLILVPMFMFIAGFLVSVVLASLYKDLAYRGLLASAYIIALPLCVALPGFVMLGGDCWGASRALLELRFTGVCSCREQLSAFRKVLPTALILLTSAYFYFILPLIHTRLF